MALEICTALVRRGKTDRGSTRNARSAQGLATAARTSREIAGHRTTDRNPVTAMFELRGVQKTFAGQAALASLDLSIPAHRTTVLLGPSGCGKSTLLRLLLGLLSPDEGTVSFDGQAVTPATATAPAAPDGLCRSRRRFISAPNSGGKRRVLARWLGKSANMDRRSHARASRPDTLSPRWTRSFSGATFGRSAAASRLGTVPHARSGRAAAR